MVPTSVLLLKPKGVLVGDAFDEDFDKMVDGGGSRKASEDLTYNVYYTNVLFRTMLFAPTADQPKS